MTDKRVILATWVGGADHFIIDGETFDKNVQRQVHAATAKRMEKEFPAQVVVVHTTEGSDEDVRVEPLVVPVQPDEEDAPVTFEPAPDPDEIASPLREVDKIDPLDSTPLDNPEVKE